MVLRNAFTKISVTNSCSWVSSWLSTFIGPTLFNAIRIWNQKIKHNRNCLGVGTHKSRPKKIKTILHLDNLQPAYLPWGSSNWFSLTNDHGIVIRLLYSVMSPVYRLFDAVPSLGGPAYNHSPMLLSIIREWDSIIYYSMLRGSVQKSISYQNKQMKK